MESLQNKEANSAERSQEYYQSDSAWNYYTIIHGSADYSGMGIWSESVMENDTATGKPYLRGKEPDTMVAANKVRDERMFKFMMENIPKGRKLKILELGSGRGGQTRDVAKKFLDMDLLDIIVGVNIAERENEYNRSEFLKRGIPAENFRIDTGSFDDLPYDNCSFDLIFSNEALDHSDDYIAVM